MLCLNPGGWRAAAQGAANGTSNETIPKECLTNFLSKGLSGFLENQRPVLDPNQLLLIGIPQRIQLPIFAILRFELLDNMACSSYVSLEVRRGNQLCPAITWITEDVSE